MNVTQFESTIAEIMEVPSGDFKHPFLTKVKFIFADNQGNANGQGIEEQDFETIAQTSINMPVKMRYTHTGAGGHELSVPIGHIVGMYKQPSATDSAIAQLVGEAVLYREEYPDEVDYLKETFEHGHAPGISWELAYKDAVKREGVDWLKDVVTRAATFVKFPAYGARTNLLAIAQTNIMSITDSMMDNTEFMDSLKEIVTELNDLVQGKTPEDDQEGDDDTEDMTLDMGGIKVDELERIQAELDAALARVTELEGSLNTATSTIATLTEENEGYKRSAVMAERTAKIVEAGIKIETDQEKLAKKQELWLAMSPEIFDAYVTDLAEASKPAAPSQNASASRPKENLPKFTAAVGTETTFDDLKSMGRKASRGISE